MPQVRILSLRPKSKREASPLSCFLLDVPVRNCFAEQNAGSHTSPEDRKARFSSEGRRYHVAKRSYPVTPTKFGFGKQFPKPFSLFPPTHFLRGDRSWPPLSLCLFCLFLFCCDFRFHGFYQLCELVLALFSCLGVDIFGYAFAADSRHESSFIDDIYLIIKNRIDDLMGIDPI